MLLSLLLLLLFLVLLVLLLLEYQTKGPNEFQVRATAQVVMHQQGHCQWYQHLLLVVAPLLQHHPPQVAHLDLEMQVEMQVLQVLQEGLQRSVEE